jgi:hypothetical protein
MKFLSRGLKGIQEAGQYAYATVEYASLASFSMLKVGGRVAAGSVVKVAHPVGQGLAWSFGEIRNLTRKLFPSRDCLDEKLRDVEAMLALIEAKLAILEQRREVLRETAGLTEASRQIDPSKQALLRQIVEANKALIDGE